MTFGQTAHGARKEAITASAALTHLRTFGERFAGRFAAVVERQRVVVYGDPCPDLRAALDEIGATYLLPLAGFSR